MDIATQQMEGNVISFRSLIIGLSVFRNCVRSWQM